MKKDKLHSVLFAIVFCFFGADLCQARGPLLAERTVAQWGGPETRTTCIREMKTKGIPNCRFKGLALHCEDTWIIACTEWRTEFKQHVMIARLYGAESISNPDQQLREISEACLASGLVLAGAPAIVAAPVNLSTEAIELGVRTCLETQNVLSRNLVSPGFEVTIETVDHW